MIKKLFNSILNKYGYFKLPIQTKSNLDIQEVKTTTIRAQTVYNRAYSEDTDSLLMNKIVRADTMHELTSKLMKIVKITKVYNGLSPVTIYEAKVVIVLEKD